MLFPRIAMTPAENYDFIYKKDKTMDAAIILHKLLEQFPGLLSNEPVCGGDLIQELSILIKSWEGIPCDCMDCVINDAPTH